MESTKTMKEHLADLELLMNQASKGFLLLQREI